jgi:hypothetical protein
MGREIQACEQPNAGLQTSHGVDSIIRVIQERLNVPGTYSSSFILASLVLCIQILYTTIHDITLSATYWI